MVVFVLAVWGGGRQVSVRRVGVWCGKNQNMDNDGWIALRCWKGEIWFILIFLLT